MSSTITTERPPSIVFAGGGTGGHIFPALAVAERLREREPAARVLFACSQRPVDTRILLDAGEEHVCLPVQPLPARLRDVLPFLRGYARSKRAAASSMAQRGVQVVVAMGGFVSGPVVAASRRRGAAVMLVNLDAVPGRANRHLARKADRVFSVYPTDRLGGGVEATALPLRRSCLSEGDAAADRAALGLDPAKAVLLVTGASQGAKSINAMMIELTRRDAFVRAMAGWQVLHLTGDRDVEALERAYGESGVAARVLTFCHTMGQAWGAAELTISRAGAGSVAEIVANAVPNLLMPYPYHKDQHQRLNAAPYVEAGAAELADDRIDPAANAEAILPRLIKLLGDADRRAAMRAALRAAQRGDGAAQLAEAALQLSAAARG